MFEHKGSFVLLSGYLTYYFVLIAGRIFILPLNNTDAVLQCCPVYWLIGPWHMTD